ncbi:Holliday junction resolvase RecU [Jeotgalibaca porci]|uniref:Holliday junction resolvase RecU n=1 Tax=Jeotgalibaca porci TaxID=1868793 RepID=UPI0035A12B78
MQSRARGYKAKKLGQNFENLIEKSCRYYAHKKIALIEKTPEPLKMVRAGRGREVVAVFEKKGQPDFKGTLKGGRSIVFEAKHTSANLIKLDRVERHQMDNLSSHNQLGAECFILISFQLKSFYRVPIEDWEALPGALNKKTANEKDLTQYKVDVKHGVVDFLGKL